MNYSRKTPYHGNGKRPSGPLTKYGTIGSKLSNEKPKKPKSSGNESKNIPTSQGILIRDPLHTIEELIHKATKGINYEKDSQGVPYSTTEKIDILNLASNLAKRDDRFYEQLAKILYHKLPLYHELALNPLEEYTLAQRIELLEEVAKINEVLPKLLNRSSIINKYTSETTLPKWYKEKELHNPYESLKALLNLALEGQLKELNEFRRTIVITNENCLIQTPVPKGYEHYLEACSLIQDYERALDESKIRLDEDTLSRMNLRKRISLLDTLTLIKNDLTKLQDVKKKYEARFYAEIKTARRIQKARNELKNQLGYETNIIKRIKYIRELIDKSEKKDLYVYSQAKMFVEKHEINPVIPESINQINPRLKIILGRKRPESIQPLESIL